MEADGDSGDHMCIKAVAADLTLGGNLFTQRLTNHCLTRLQALGAHNPQAGLNLSKYQVAERRCMSSYVLLK